jgi:hypothetical protein
MTGSLSLPKLSTRPAAQASCGVSASHQPNFVSSEELTAQTTGTTVQ